ncbi:MAG: phosphatidate cytidylyltransferase [Candidatus Ancaeobacter aquaticus]|nr:phosphatidate cytidylyltransferase [Candidatus Ancaeobacter aquaticus]
MLAKRLISSAFLGVLFAVTLLTSNTQPWLLLTVANLFVGFGMYEVLSMVEKKGVFVFKLYVVSSGIVFSSSIFFSIHNLIPNDYSALVILAFFVGLLILYGIKNGIEGSMFGIFASIGTVFYVSWFFSFLMRINYMQPNGGGWLIFYIFVMVYLSDIFAYGFGNLFGRHKLAPVISPKKTVEGAIGGIVGAVCGAVLGKLFFVQGLAWHHVLYLGLIIGFVSQIGDLFESILKRDAGVKDSGHFIPGMGGVMDLIDGLLFCAPVIYLYLKIFVN